MKLHEIIITTGLAGVIFIGFILFYADGVSHYGTSGLDVSHLQNINHSLSNLKANSERTNAQLNAVSGLPAGLNVLGTIIVGAAGALRTTWNSFQVIGDVVTDSGTYLPFGSLYQPFFGWVTMSLLIVFIIAIIAKYYSPSDTL